MPVCFPELYNLYYNKMKSLLLTSDLFFQDLFHGSAHWYHPQTERHDETLFQSPAYDTVSYNMRFLSMHLSAYFPARDTRQLPDSS